MGLIFYAALGFVALSSSHLSYNKPNLQYVYRFHRTCIISFGRAQVEEVQERKKEIHRKTPKWKGTGMLAVDLIFFSGFYM
ncbi:hypothetical protein ACFX19_044176 [Malus domestica]